MLTLRTLYEIEQARRNLEDAVAHQQQIRAAVAAGDKKNGRFLDKLHHGWSILSKLRSHRIRITLEPRQPYSEAAPRQA